ncbi:hypothetical protein KC19_8G099800 [Ceratodon purpureus]|uniref:DUF7748 domain-containing protein n=1 Tax=Ceratodon purpureus TaxID=3225 RepID=A0A8T0H5B8_CERPU|nr:hypothetical protein KC19_8G099800 [Ceratodon purpureus]KAG0564303.1 hypothetical protein KC19_8G099800 [Ceratodon purpureus]
MGLKTKVVNTTNKNFLLKEGTGGIYRLLKTLLPKESYTINVDPNATYREYWCAVKDDDPKAVILSSDDCQEYAVVNIREKVTAQGGISQAPSYFWDGVLRDSSKQKAKDASSNSNSGETSNESFFEKIMSKLGFSRRGNPQK